MADENGDKTEQPSDHRRQEAREEGNVVRSVDLTAAALLLAVALAMQFGGAELITVLSRILRNTLESPAWTELDAGLLSARLYEIGQELALPFLIMLGTMAGGVLLINLAQVGFLWSGDALSPKFNRINPLEGFQRIFSMSSLVRLATSFGKLVLLTSLVGWFLWSTLGQFLGMGETTLETAAVNLGETMINLAYQLAGGLLLLAILDYGFQYWKFEQDLKMTKQEVRDEMRHMEGDPLIRMRRREVHRKLANSQQMRNVRDADFVGVNPIHFAVAIKYDPLTMEAPKVVAKGRGEIAEQIKRVAEEAGVPIITNIPLARTLYATVKVGGMIPIDLYNTVAEILGYVYKLRKRGKQRAA